MDADGPISSAGRFEFSGGALCLDFANTLGDPRPGAEDGLARYDDLLDWAVEGGAIDPETGRRLRALALQSPVAARRNHRRAVGLRETIHRIFSALAAGGIPPAVDLATLNAALPKALSKLRVEIDPSGCCWTWAPREDALDSPLWPVLRSAANLLTSSEARRVRECASETCRWLFLDRSRAGGRRWCDMSTCGNRAKARRHYRRKKTRSAGAEAS